MSASSASMMSSCGAVSMQAAPAIISKTPHSSPANRKLKTKSPTHVQLLLTPIPVKTNNYSLRYPPKMWCESPEGRKIELISKLCNKKKIQEIDALVREKAFSFGILPVILYNAKEKRNEYIDYMVKEVMNDVENYNSLATEDKYYEVNSAVVKEFLVRLVEAADRVKNEHAQPAATCSCVIM